MRFYAGWLILFVILNAALVSAQNPPETANQTPSPVTSVVTNSNDTNANQNGNSYRIGIDDLLDIKVFGVDQLNREVRVSPTGYISLPRVEEPIKAQCLSVAELAQTLEAKYGKYIRNPHVDITVKEYKSLPVSVIGAVLHGGQFELRRRVRLLELISLSGGVTDKAGTVVNVVHNEDLITCESSTNPRPAFETISINAIYENQPNANFYVQPGDIINIPNANIIYVAGNVVRPGSFPINEPLTVTKAIALSGGLQPDTAKDKIRIIRQNPGAADSELTVDLTAIEKKKVSDVMLRSNDIVMVPDSKSTSKTFLRTVLGALGVGLGNVPITVIR